MWSAVQTEEVSEDFMGLLLEQGVSFAQFYRQVVSKVSC